MYIFLASVLVVAALSSCKAKPENITCVLHYKEESNGVPDLFTCTWKHHVHSSQAINYTILHRFSDNSEIEICKSQVTNCTSTDDAAVSKMFFEFLTRIIVRAKTAAWEVESDTYIFKTLHILKINPPIWEERSPSSDHLLVKWNAHCSTDNCQCQVKYYKTSESNDKAPKYLNTSQSQFSATIKDMDSCINYSISVRCASGEGLWSNWNQKETVLTKLNESHIRLRLWRKVAKQRKNGKRKVHLMWKGIPSTCEEVLNYTVKQVPYKDNTTTGNFTLTSCGNSSCDVDVDQHTHRLYLTVSDNNTLLDEKFVYVPAAGETGLPEVCCIQTTNHEGVIQVSWNVSKKPISSYIIDWTYDGNEYYWKETTFTNATLFGLLDRRPYNITVTPLFNDSTGHRIDANQICSSMGVPEHIDVTIEEVQDKSVFVKWDTKSQYICSDVVNYIIFYEAQGLQHNITVDGNEDGVWLKDLNPNTQYKVKVEATGYNRTNMGKTMYFTTNKFDSSLIKTLSACGGFLVFLVLFLGLTCAIQWKKFNEIPVPNPRLSSVAKWLTQSHQKMEGFFQPVTDQIENEVVKDETQRERGAPVTPVCNGNETCNQKLTISDPSFSPIPENEPDERFSETSETRLLSSPEGSMVFSSSQSSPYRSQTSVVPLLPRVEKPSKSQLGKKQEKTTQKTLYVSLNMFEQSDVR
ncbi:interleukin-31 receptor subunit alpha-like isoform 2-T2 [Anableps anableps]